MLILIVISRTLRVFPVDLNISTGLHGDFAIGVLGGFSNFSIRFRRPARLLKASKSKKV